MRNTSYIMTAMVASDWIVVAALCALHLSAKPVVVYSAGATVALIASLWCDLVAAKDKRNNL